MTPLVVGTLAIDTLEFPTHEVVGSFGGSASFAVTAAALFGPVRLVAAVGEDFPPDFRALLADRDVDLSGVVTHPGEKMFRWRGRYHDDLNRRETVEFQLNVIAAFDPVLPDNYRNSPRVLVANMPPERQHRVIRQLAQPRFVMLDTVDDWVIAHRNELFAVLADVDLLLINDAEARLLADTDNLIQAGMKLVGLGPPTVVVKKGEHGCVLFDRNGASPLPAYPTEQVIDPTGAGDSFAGGLLGYLGTQPEVTPRVLRRGLCYGSVIASITVEGYGLDRLKSATRHEVEERLAKYLGMLDVG